ncbi:MAG: hypothetical protein ACE5I1_04270 [bacterium]
MRCKHIFLLLTATILASCAGQRKPAQLQLPAKPALTVPAGIDSSIARLAAKTVPALLISFEDEATIENKKQAAGESLAKADSLLKFVRTLRDTTGHVSQENSRKSIHLRNDGGKKAQKVVEKENRIATTPNAVQSAKIRHEIRQLLNAARRDFEAAIELNPKDEDSRNGLAWVLERIIYYSGEMANTALSDSLVVALTILTELDRSDHQYVFRLAQEQYRRKKWPQALHSIRTAKNKLLDFAFLNAPGNALAPDDSVALFDYLYYEADILVEFGLADTRYAAKDTVDLALNTLGEALKYAPDAGSKQQISDYIDWINWDGGNIRASHEKDQILNAFVRSQNAGKTVERLKGLQHKLITQKAMDEISWRIALMQFSDLQQPDSALTRMYGIARRAMQYQKQAPGDTLYQRIVDDYCTLCNNMAVYYLDEKISRTLAFTYLLQATQMDCDLRGKIYLELARLSRYDHAKRIAYCLQALQYLSPGDMENLEPLIKYLIRSYRKLGDVVMLQRWYTIWQHFEEQQFASAYLGIAELFKATDTLQFARWATYALENYSDALSTDERDAWWAQINASHQAQN